MAKKKHKKDPGKKQKASRSPQGKQRQERRDGWNTRKRQVTGRARLMCPRTATSGHYWSSSNGGPSEGQGGCAKEKEKRFPDTVCTLPPRGL
ncbi:hypothetical protein HaLaN_12065, partial [Haematococcus lacustris]